MKIKNKYFEVVEKTIPIYRNMLEYTPNDIAENVQEIRFRSNGPVSLVTNNEIWYLNKNGVLSKTGFDFLCHSKDIEESVKKFCNYSLFNHIDELSKGFLTLYGGHRVGICGVFVFEGERIKTVKNISSLNIRIAREIKGVSDNLLKRFDYNNSFLIIGPPSSGKTTLLRDIARNLSFKNQVLIIDERNEISAMYNGTPQNEIGFNSDVILGLNKIEGINIGIRTMSPQYIVIDEIASDEECEKLIYAANNGAKIVAAIHAESKEEFLNKPFSRRLIESKIFNNYIFLKSGRSKCSIESIVNENELF